MANICYINLNKYLDGILARTCVTKNTKWDKKCYKHSIPGVYGWKR
jgi:hypothetical protein